MMLDVCSGQGGDSKGAMAMSLGLGGLLINKCLKFVVMKRECKKGYDAAKMRVCWKS
jgi:hypothetical protein